MTRTELLNTNTQPTAPWFGAALMLAVLLSLTWFTWRRISHDEQANLELNFQDRVDEAQDRVLKRMIASEQVLWGVRAIFAGSERVERGEFRAYVTALALGEHSPGIQAIGYVRAVRPEDLGAHVAEVRQSIPEYNVHPPGERALYAPIMFLAPFEGRNLLALGFDMFTEPVRTAAMALSRDHAQAVLSGRVRLVQEPEGELQAGVLMYVPVYSNGHRPPLTPEERRSSLEGWTYAAFRMGDLLEGTLPRGEDFVVRLYDGTSLAPEALLYDSSRDAPRVTPRPGLVARRTMRIAERDWTLLVEARPSFGAALVNRTGRIIGVGGAVVSVLAAALVFLLLGARSRAERRAIAMNRELLEAHAALEQSELRFRRMADHAPVLIWTAGPNGGCDWFNRPWLDFTGRTREDSIDERWAEAVHPDDRPRVLDTYRGALTRRAPFKLEYRLRRHDGVFRWLLDAGVPQVDEQGRFTGFVGSCVDIHDHREREALLRDSELRLRLATKGGDLATWDFSFGGDTLQFSERFSEMLGVSPPRLEWTLDALAERTHPEDLGVMQHAQASQARGETTALRAEIRLKHEQGHWVWALVSGMVVEATPEGVPLRAAGTVLDISERKRAEAERAELLARFSLAERFAALGTLAGGMAHEINNPLAVVISNLSFAREQLGQPLDPAAADEMKEALDDASASAGRVRDLVAELRSLTASDRAPEASTGLQPVLEAALRIARLAAGSSTTFEVALAPGLPPVRGSEPELVQLFASLLTNAAQSADAARPNPVRISAERADGAVRVVISDQGVGMPPELARRVFDPFFTTRGPGAGKGLGGPVALAIARSIGGDLELESEEGRGTTVKVTLPAAPPPR